LTYQGHKLRLAYVADAMNVHTQRWVRWFLDRGCECKVVSYRPGEIPGAEVYVHSTPPTGFDRMPLLKQIHTASDYRRVRSILRWADIVHVHFIYRYRFNVLFKGIPRLVVSTWGKDIIRDTKDLEPKSEIYWKRFVLRQATVITATTHFLANETRVYAPYGKDIKVIPFGVDLTRFDPALFPRPEGESPIQRIGFLKHLRTKYGADTLIEATGLLREKGYKVRTILAGEGEDEHELRKFAHDKGVGKVIDFVGRVPHEEVPAFLASLDVFVMPSRWQSETFGVAAVEAEAMEIPVVATNVGGVPEAVKNDVTGILIEPDDPKTLAKAIAKLLNDPKLRAMMGKAGREFVKENYDWTENAGRMEAVYKSLL
jgi:glycosyltransferase involved in cell wall biosynthesis